MSDEVFILKIVFPYSNNQYIKHFNKPKDLVKFIEEKYLNGTKPKF